MKLAIISTLITLFIGSLALNVGLITGYIRIGTPEQQTQMAVVDYNKNLIKQITE